MSNNTERHVCEQCGAVLKKLNTKHLLHVFGKVYYFCCDNHQNFWLKHRSGVFRRNESVRFSYETDGE